MITMKHDNWVLSKCDKEVLFDRLYHDGLPLSQALAVHLIVDQKMRPCEAGAILGVSTIAVSDAKRKGMTKIDET